MIDDEHKVRINSEDYVIMYVVAVDGGGTKTGVYEESPGVPAVYGDYDAAHNEKARLHQFAENCGVDIHSWIMKRAT